MQNQELIKKMASTQIAWSLEKKRSEEISANQPEPGKLDEDEEEAEPETPPLSPEPLPSQQSPAA